MSTIHTFKGGWGFDYSRSYLIRIHYPGQNFIGLGFLPYAYEWSSYVGREGCSRMPKEKGRPHSQAHSFVPRRRLGLSNPTPVLAVPGCLALKERSVTPTHSKLKRELQL